MTISRRRVLAAPLALSALSALPTRSAFAQGPTENQVVIRTTGGVFEEALKRNFFDPFTRDTGIRVIPVAASYGEMMSRAAAMESAGHVEWDIISPQYYELGKLQHLLEDLGDCSSLPNIAAQGVPGTCGRYGTLYLVGGQVLTWNTEVFAGKPTPQSWADFWDVKKFPGRRALPNTGSPWASLIVSLIADGVEPARLFPLDLDRAFRKLDAIKPHIDVWWRTGNQSQQIMRSGDIAMTLMWSGTAFAGKRQGIPIAWTWNNAVADFGAWGILRGAPHPKAARAFIDYYVTKPEHHVGFAREMGYTTTNAAAQAQLSPQEKAELGASAEIRKQIISPDADWLEKNRAAALERWNKWLAA